MIKKIAGLLNKNNSKRIYEEQNKLKIKNINELIKRLQSDNLVLSLFKNLENFNKKDRIRIFTNIDFLSKFVNIFPLKKDNFLKFRIVKDYRLQDISFIILLIYVLYGVNIFNLFFDSPSTDDDNSEEFELTDLNVNNFSNIKKKYEFNFVTDISERLSDVKGIDNVSEEIQEVIDMLKNPDKYSRAGAKLIKGILLVGQPGTGKTLLARALAGEAQIKFININAAEFDKAIVGQSDAMIRELFKKARRNQPCIIFIDEIDSLLHSSRRGNKSSASHERSVVNTFLSEMDGFKPRDHIFVLGATNSESGLDEAALRPGRFDKIIYVPMPDIKGREEIFKLYLNKVNLFKGEEVNANKLAAMTPGFSGAEVESMVNYAVIDAVDSGKDTLSLSIFDEARDRIVLGIKRKFKNGNLRSLLQLSIHEAGHTLICYRNKICKDNIHKVSIAKRGKTKGITSTLQGEIEGTKEEFISKIDMALGGILAEELYFGLNKVSVGCGNDLNRASDLAKSMVKKYAMSKKFGYMVVKEEGHLVNHRISEFTRDELDHGVVSIVNKRTEIVKEILNENIIQLKSLAQKLVEYDELNKQDIDDIINGNDLNKEKKRLGLDINTILK